MVKECEIIIESGKGKYLRVIFFTVLKRKKILVTHYFKSCHCNVVFSVQNKVIYMKHNIKW